MVGSLRNKGGSAGSRMVRIVPVFPQYLSDSMDGLGGKEDDGINGDDELIPESHKGLQLPLFLASLRLLRLVMSLKRRWN